MSRAKFQTGSLQKVGKGPKQKYVVRYRVYDLDGSIIAQPKETVGLCSEMSKREATAKAQEIVNKKTHQLPAAPQTADKSRITLKEFFDQRYFLLHPDWTEAHRDSVTWYMNRYVFPRLGDKALGDIDKVTVQTLLNRMASNYSEETIKGVRRKLHAVMEEAVEQDFITRNPVHKTTISSQAEAPDLPLLSEEQLIQIIDAITDVRDKAIFMIGTFCALRSSELFGLTWGQLQYDDDTAKAQLLIKRIAYRGKLFNRTKTKGSRAAVPIGGSTLAAVLAWKEECGEVSDDTLMFPAQSHKKSVKEKAGTTVSSGSWLTHFRKTIKHLKIPFNITFQCTRRTAATLVQEDNSLASASGLLRHSKVRAQTTAEKYTMVVDERVAKAVNDLEARVYAARPGPKLLKKK